MDLAFKEVLAKIAKNTNCTIEALSKEGGLDEFNSIFASIDEFHQHKDNSIYKTLWQTLSEINETLEKELAEIKDENVYMGIDLGSGEDMSS